MRKSHLNQMHILKIVLKVAIKLINLGVVNSLINGPISKKNFLKNKFLGITEYLAKRI